MRLCVVGTGYVGLVAGACFAELGHDVVCVDVDLARIDSLRAGRVPFHEPGLEPLVARLAASGRLTFSASPVEADAVFIAVGTPVNASGVTQLGSLDALVTSLAVMLPTVVVLKSTVPVGTTARVAASLPRHHVAFNPEFLREGSALDDFRRPSRIIIGTDSARARDVLLELHRPLGASVLVMDSRSAELSKYAANAMLATRISFMNELSHLATSTGADLAQVQQAIGSDPRIGPHYLSAGIGWGGSCLPKDLSALRALGREHGQTTALLDAVHDVNERQKRVLVDRAKAHFGSLAGLQLAVWGLSFKPDTDDLRGSPALALVEALLAEGAQVGVFDPVAMPGARAVLGDRVTWGRELYEVLVGADALFVATEWRAFREADLSRVKAALRRPVVFDGRGVFGGRGD
jgi:UDPglucose 6-dehydrogenase